MHTLYQQKIWASLSVYAFAFLLLIFSINEISCEHEAVSLDKHQDNNYPIDADVEDPAGISYLRDTRAAPLRWGKRNIDKRSTDEDDDGTSGEVIDGRNTRASPLRWGKRMLEDSLMRPVRATPLRWGKRSVDSQLYDLYNKRAPLRWGKRAPSRFGKRAPMRFGKRENKRAPMRFGKRESEEMRDPRIRLNLNDISSLGKRDPDPRVRVDLNALMNGQNEWNNDYGNDQ